MGVLRCDARTVTGVVLVVDDEDDIRELLAEELVLEGYEVSTAAHGQEAVVAAHTRHYDVAITDLRMPVMDGYATLTELRRIDPSIRVIVATGFISRETRADCLARGAFDFISKPFDLDDVLTRVARALSRVPR